MAHISVTEISGAGAIFSNVIDFAKWVSSLIHKTKPFSEAVHDDIQEPRFMASLPTKRKDVVMYGLGWGRFLYKGHVLYTHSGGVHAFGSEVFWLPGVKYGVVSFGNTGLSSNAAEHALIYKLIDEKLGIRDEDRDDPETR